MKRKLFLAALPLLAFVGLFTLSSFFHPTDQPEPDVKYRSQSKQSTHNGPMRMSTGFQNDYFTDQKNEGFFYIELEADQFSHAHHTRPAMNLSVVIDRSGSMSGDKIRNAKRAAQHIVDQLNADDYLSIIVYDQEVSTLHHQAAVTDKEAIKRKIDGIQDRGSTNLMGGALRGYEEVNKYYRSGYINRVLLLSDGLANEGITDPTRIKQIVQSKFKENNIAISTFGVGTDYNEDLMTAMAESGKGNYYFIEKPDAIASIFRKELNGLMEVVAQQTKITISVPNAVKIEEAFGYTHTQKGSHVEIKLNDIFSKETKGILLRYSINRSEMPNNLNFVTSLSFTNASSKRNTTLALQNNQQFTNSASVYNEHFSEWVEAQVVLNQANYKMEMAMQAIDRGDYEQGRAMVKETKDYISSKKTLVVKSEELQRAQVANSSYDVEISDIEDRSENERKYIQKSNKSTNYMIRSKK